MSVPAAACGRYVRDKLRRVCGVHRAGGQQLVVQPASRRHAIALPAHSMGEGVPPPPPLRDQLPEPYRLPTRSHASRAAGLASPQPRVDESREPIQPSASSGSMSSNERSRS